MREMLSFDYTFSRKRRQGRSLSDLELPISERKMWRRRLKSRVLKSLLRGPASRSADALSMLHERRSEMADKLLESAAH